jgi:threonine/homoserine/homoserine lactone efflux protein
MFISFLGTLPLGTLNISAMQIAMDEGIRGAILFAFGALIVEMVYVRLSLSAIGWVLEWVTLFIIIALSVSSFLAASRPGDGQNALLSGSMPKFLLGLLMSAVNPAQIPFWFGWSGVLMSRGTLQAENRQFNAYILGIGTGTFLGFSVFIFGGQWVVGNLQQSRATVQTVIGIIFGITAILQGWRMLKKKPAALGTPGE